MAANKLIVLEDSVIKRLMSNPTAANEFPFLRTLAKQQGTAPAKPRCGSCSSKQRTVQDYSAVRQAVARLSDDQKSRLKQLLDTEKIRVLYRDSARRLVKLTF